MPLTQTRRAPTSVAAWRAEEGAVSSPWTHAAALTRPWNPWRVLMSALDWVRGERRDAPHQRPSGPAAPAHSTDDIFVDAVDGDELDANEAHSARLTLPPGVHELCRAEMIGRKLKVLHSTGRPYPAANFERYCTEATPGCWVRHFPVELDMSASRKPVLEEHANRGVSVYFQRPDLNFAREPAVLEALKCCGEKLRHGECSLTQESGQIKAIFRAGRRPAFAAQSHYKCTKCGKTYGATDAYLLRRLPRRFRGLYPVKPEYSRAKSNFHFGASFTEVASLDMVTYDNGDHIMQKHSNFLSAMYDNHLNDFLDHWLAYRGANPDDRSPIPEFPSKVCWMGRSVPTGETFRRHYERAHYEEHVFVGVEAPTVDTPALRQRKSRAETETETERPQQRSRERETLSRERE